MKTIVLLCDGMADRPSALLGGRTPMEAACKPNMDRLAGFSELGMVRTVPYGIAPGSDVANLAVLGYDTRICYTGRSPLEAANIGINLKDDDVAFRCNMVTLSTDDTFEQKIMLDYCAGDISTEEADEIIRSLQKEFGGSTFDFYTGTAYRHCMVWHGGKTELGNMTPPHDISGQKITAHLSSHPDAAPLLDMMRRSVDLLQDHPVNLRRAAKGLPPASAIWLWGQGKRPQLQNFVQRFGLQGSMISAVDLLKGIGRLTGMHVCDVPGATGYIDTNYEGKKDAALHELQKGQDFVYIHLEGPDECGHRGEAMNKVKAIEDIDRRILGPLLEALPSIDDFTLLILPDHPTPLDIRTHDRAPVPYLLYHSAIPLHNAATVFTESSANASGILIDPGYTLLSHALQLDKAI